MLTHLIEILFVACWNGLGSLIGRWRNAACKSAASPEPSVLVGHILPLDAGPLAPQVGQKEYLREKDLQTHLHVIGASGSGKTNYLLSLLFTLLDWGYTIVIVDFLGDLIDRLLLSLASRYSPEALAERLVLQDHRQDAWVVPCANPLTWNMDAHGIAQFVIALIRRFVGLNSLGVTVEEALLHSLVALAEAGGRILDILPLLEDSAFRTTILLKVQSPETKRYLAAFERYEERDKRALIGAVANKLLAFTSVPKIRAVFAQAKGISMQELIDHPGRIIPIALGGDRHQATAQALGSLYLAAIQQAVLSRASLPEQARQPTFVLIDEFGLLAEGNTEFETLISNGRRLKGHLVLAHQNLLQVETRLRHAVRNNVGASLLFATGSLDASELCHDVNISELKPEQIRSMLINQEVGQAFLLRRGQKSLHVQTLPYTDPEVHPEAVEALRLASWRRWARQIDLTDASPQPPDTHPRQAANQPDVRPGQPTAAPAEPSVIEVIDHDDTPPKRGKRRPRSS